MMHDHFHAALERCDVALVRKMAGHIWPHLPKAKTDADALVSIHYARTSMESMPFRLRAYSHAWLTERGYPSGLQDELKPKAQRLYPIIARSVGISVNSQYEAVREGVGGAMRRAVLEAEGDGNLDDDAHVKRRMHEAREREKKALGLI